MRRVIGVVELEPGGGQEAANVQVPPQVIGRSMVPQAQVNRQVQLMAAGRAADRRLKAAHPDEWAGYLAEERLARGLSDPKDDKIARLKEQLRALGVEVD